MWTMKDVEVDMTLDGRQAISTSTDGTAILWDLVDQREIQRFAGHEDVISDIAFTPDHLQLLTSSGRFHPGMTVSKDNTIRLWDVETGENTQEYRGHTDGVTSISISPDGASLLSGSIDQSARLWDVATGEQIQNLEGHGNFVTDISFSSQENAAVSSSVLGTLLLWDLERGKFTHSFPSTGEIYKLAVSPDGGKAISGGSGESPIFIWDLETGFESNRFWGHMGEDRNLSAMALDTNGNFAFSGDTSGTLIQWDVNTLEEMLRTNVHTSPIADISINADNTRGLSCDESGTLILWDLEVGTPIGQFQPPYAGMMYACEISADGTRAAFSVDNTVYLWRLDIPSLDKLQDWINTNRYVRELTCEERARYVIEPLCEE